MLAALLLLLCACGALSAPGGVRCCETCNPSHSKACGDACISLKSTCHTAPGCACNGAPSEGAREGASEGGEREEGKGKAMAAAASTAEKSRGGWGECVRINVVIDVVRSAGSGRCAEKGERGGEGEGDG